MYECRRRNKEAVKLRIRRFKESGVREEME